jgi:hypothetical protein
VVNEDIIKLNYSEPMNLYQELVVSKLRIPDPITPLCILMLNSDLKWISAIAVKTVIINNENETHLEIFF